MPSFFLINTIFVFLINIISIWLGFWVYLSNRKAKINQIFFLMTLFVIAWISSAYFCNFLAQDYFARLWARIGYGAGSLFFLSLYLFYNSFPKKERRLLNLNRLIIIVSLFLFFFSVFTNLVVRDITLTEWGTLPVLGAGKFAFFGFISFLGFFAIIQLFIKYFRMARKEKLKAQYFWVGLLIFLITNLIFNVILPIWQKIPQYYYIGNYSAIFLLAFTAYAIVKQELFGIKVVITAIFVTSIAIVLALDALIFTSEIYLQLFKGLILIAFLYLGYALIKSVMREIKQREKIEKLSKAKSEFISIASHQLRTPLTAIKGYISMILEGTYGETSSKVKEPMKKVYISNERLINLVNNLLSISRIESGKMGIEFEKVSIEGLISNIVDMFGIEAKKKKIFLKFKESKKPLPKVLIDEEKITDVISNIINNCIKYTGKGGITVKVQKLLPRNRFGVKRKSPKLRITISDTGEGITKEELSKMFQSFSRGMAGTKLYTEGAGLGLYVAKKYVEMHKGKIWVESPGKDKGSTFYIELPMK